MAGSTLQQSIGAAQAHAAAGRVGQARAAYEDACRKAMAEGSKVDPYMAAAATLGFADLVLQKDGYWPELNGQHLDELLSSSLEVIRGLDQRQRQVEGQLLILRSRALFAKPGKDVACLDAAVEARHEGLRLLEEGAVEALPWKIDQVKSLMDQERPRAEELLAEDELLTALCVMGKPKDVSSYSMLFDAWSISDASGGAARITLNDFLSHFLSMAQGLNRAVDKEPCRAPCEGGLPANSSELEKELVALVSKSGMGDWEKKAEWLRKGGHHDATAAAIEALWAELAPKIKKTVEADAPMACGHSCSTCPTRDDCQLHDALKDIEDIF